ncbi:MAG TPA: helix-turn-helix domain-containing protein, partial [Acidimicrobiales bacterium]
MADPVKGKSPAGRRREQRARATRQRIVAAATALFGERGYAATTVGAIAGEAGVAPATVYQAFGTKSAILKRALDEAIVGDAEPLPLLERDWVAAARREPDARRRLAIVVGHT